MKRRDLLRHLSKHGCSLLREGSNHSWWQPIWVFLGLDWTLSREHLTGRPGHG